MELSKAKDMTLIEPPARRSELLYYYDARMCNPNGDTMENKPRFDEATGKVRVTEFRLKRTERKYLNENMDEPILLRQEIDEVTESESGQTEYKRLEKLAKEYLKPFTIKVEKVDKKR